VLLPFVLVKPPVRGRKGRREEEKKRQEWGGVEIPTLNGRGISYCPRPCGGSTISHSAVKERMWGGEYGLGKVRLGKGQLALMWTISCGLNKEFRH
jgi:hypothetical protein